MSTSDVHFFQECCLPAVTHSHHFYWDFFFFKVSDVVSCLGLQRVWHSVFDLLAVFMVPVDEIKDERLSQSAVLGCTQME